MARNAAVSLTPGNLASRLLKVAWLAILLGLGLQALLLLTALGFGKELQLDAVVAESVNKVAWAFLVCFGLALDSAASKAGPTSFALAGLLAAPVAFIAARSLHKIVAQALDVLRARYPNPYSCSRCSRRSSMASWDICSRELAQD